MLGKTGTSEDGLGFGVVWGLNVADLYHRTKAPEASSVIQSRNLEYDS